MDDRWNLIPPLRYDSAEIKRSIRIEDAIRQYVGTEPNRAGFIRCPDPTHKDDKPSCKIYTETNNCKCFSCDGYFTVFDLAAFAKGLDRKRDFPILCEEICNDFGINKYSVSNLGERESAIEQIFGEPKKVEYKEYFPLTETELNMIGLYNSDFKIQKENYKYSADANSYFKEILGYEEVSKIPEHLIKSYGITIVNDILCDKTGNPLTIPLTFQEAVELGFERPLEEREKEYKMIPKIQELWKDEENRAGVEEMIVGHFEEVYSKEEKDYNEYKKLIDDYENSHDIEREEKLYQAYNEREKKQVKFNNLQVQRVHDYSSYVLTKMFFEDFQKSFADLEKIKNKLSTFFQRRAGYEAETDTDKDDLEIE